MIPFILKLMINVSIYQLTEELRCPKCDNQSLAGSNSPISADMRKQIYTLLQAGHTHQEIKQYMVDRYDVFVYRPPLQKNTLFLWLLPLLICCLGLVVLFLSSVVLYKCQY